MNKLPVSVFIITLNEEHNIARAIESVKFADEVIIVDSGSTDKTLEIIRSFGIEPIHNDWPGYAKQKQFAMEQCKNEWVLNIDADEEITPALANKFSEIIKNDKYASVRCTRNDVFIGKVSPSWTKTARLRRFYKKSKAYFDTTRLVHEIATVEGKELIVRENIIHYGNENIEFYTEKKNLYSSLKAKEKYLKGKRFSYAKLLLIFPLVFIQHWIFYGKIFYGIRGLILSIVQAHYSFIKEAKLYEHSLDKKY
jgi:glycosyltransferase involved in cell wall biosynthesis